MLCRAESLHREAAENEATLDLSGSSEKQLKPALLIDPANDAAQQERLLRRAEAQPMPLSFWWVGISHTVPRPRST